MTPDDDTHDTDRPPPIIPARGAELALAQAFHRLVHAVTEAEQLAMAVARALDQGATETR